MAQLYAMLNCFQYPRMSIRMTMSSPLDSRHGVQLNLGEQTMERSLQNLYAMNGGEGPNSYAQNSSYQRGVVDVAKPIIEEEIAMKLDVKQLLSTNTKSFRIADFGCSTGHNSFPAMQIITEAVEKKFRTEGLNSQGPDFQASLDFAYCSCALNWLSEVPKAVADHNSPAWNNGKVHYTEARQEVFEAYSNHYANNIGAFLDARAQELVQGGLMALLVPAVPAFKNSGTSYTTPTEIDLIGSCLVDMAKKGRFGEEKVDSFNFPLYFTIPEELKTIIGRSDNFNIERMEILNNPGKRTLRSANARATYLRAVFEGLLINHFGSEFMDELFELYTKKLAASPHFLDPDNEKSIIYCSSQAQS
ncbi:putative S-adenosylmethionine-dependent methyltransferase [Sesamum angolense]|uniref:S-adenosylmethionine-dependent methyltransferase n=1 Tax=Sesamum angolense TaxID=2727404 RepID=A0AAE1WVP7_9LAMI|nr:putative S-adenosylmethionine-dependent methyltransferase [Sesamum angolense]